MVSCITTCHWSYWIHWFQSNAVVEDLSCLSVSLLTRSKITVTRWKSALNSLLANISYIMVQQCVWSSDQWFVTLVLVALLRLFAQKNTLAHTNCMNAHSHTHTPCVTCIINIAGQWAKQYFKVIHQFIGLNRMTSTPINWLRHKSAGF